MAVTDGPYISTLISVIMSDENVISPSFLTIVIMSYENVIIPSLLLNVLLTIMCHNF